MIRLTVIPAEMRSVENTCKLPCSRSCQERARWPKSRSKCSDNAGARSGSRMVTMICDTSEGFSNNA